MTVVETASGRVRGETTETPRGPVVVFRGIPYALAPVGPLRLRPPVPAEPWAGVRDALETGPRSIQPWSLLAPAGEPEDEDCLVLNVWTPSGATAGAATDSLPVMVWIHGGSFTGGSGALSWYDGARLASRGVVVVTVNYRLGALGFLDLASIGGEAWAGCTNVGLQDQSLALAWVSDHIAAFGGDPDRVTIFGESAGAMSVSSHLALPASAGRFRRAIAQSGAAGHVQSAESGARVAARALEILDVGHDRLHELADLPADAFRDLTATISSEDPDHDLPLPFRPTVDGAVLPIAPLDAIATGAAAEIALLAGTNHDEMNLFRLVALLTGGSSDLDGDRLLRRATRALESRGRPGTADELVAAYRGHRPGASNADLWSAVGTDTTFRMPMISMLDAQVAGGGSAWSYHFAVPSTAFEGSVGAAHAVEIPFVFDNLDQPGTAMILGEPTDDRRAVASELADRWVAFASVPELDAVDAADGVSSERSGWTVPGSDRLWPRYEPEARRQVLVDAESSVVERFEDDLRALWLD